VYLGVLRSVLICAPCSRMLSSALVAPMQVPRPLPKPKVELQPPPGVPRSSLSKKRKAAQMETAASRGTLPPEQPLQELPAPAFDFLGG